MIVSKTVSFAYAHRLLGHQGRCRFVHGHNGRVEILLACYSLDKMGMVVDFTDIKNSIGKWIDDNWDHSFMYNSDDVVAEKMHRELLAAGFADRVVVFPKMNPTAENMCLLLEDAVRNGSMSALLKNVQPERAIYAKFRVYETDNSYADSERWVTVR